MDKYLIALGGGSLAEKTTALIDKYIAAVYLFLSWLE